MARRIHLQPYLSIDELEHRYRTAKEPNERTWWQILWLLAQGRTATELSAVIGYRAYWIGQIAKRYNEQGPDGMRNRRHTTSYRPAPVLSPDLQEELRTALSQAAAQNQLWTGTDVAAWMSERLGRQSREADRAGTRPSRLAYQCAPSGSRACASLVSAALFAGIAAGRTSLATD
jgi:hypothetical protein